ncbi:unnamed protein product [Ceutorhynchus assimilis]|uniref:Uncharacterized protein n=1 Tax=Ceutorhynchus assimilis TaxID=467358 RepID=A0A9N9MDC8_9CUCU|nr:unnamed protein product [Ceutorhynchus assimilis]
MNNMQIFATFCTLFLAQALIIHAKPESKAAEIQDAADVAEKVFVKLMAVIHKALDEASASLKAAVQTVNATATKLEDKAHDAFDLAMKPLNAKLKELLEEAKKLGANTTDCEHYIDDLTNLPNNLGDNMVECMTDQIFKATGYVDDILNHLHEIEQRMANYTNKIHDCKGKIWKEVKCLAHLSAEMAKDTVDVPLKIAADVGKTVLLINTLIPKVGLCYTTNLAQLPTQGLDIVGKFAKCVGVPQI